MVIEPSPAELADIGYKISLPVVSEISALDEEACRVDRTGKPYISRQPLWALTKRYMVLAVDSDAHIHRHYWGTLGKAERCYKDLAGVSVVVQLIDTERSEEGVILKLWERRDA
jgi:hypothetical protein